MAPILDEPVVAGPFHLFDSSFVLEFLNPDASRNASVLMRCTVKHEHPYAQIGKKNPFCPPFHLHFEQIETFTVIQGKLGLTTGFSPTDMILTPSDGDQEVGTWIPHLFFPVADVGEDTIFLVRAHPNGTPEAMDGIFFRNLLLYVSDVSEKKVALDPLQIMLTQHVTATAMVWFPTIWWLGPLRWWIPWKIQAGFAAIARLVGKKPVMVEYTAKQDWEAFQSGKLKVK